MPPASILLLARAGGEFLRQTLNDVGRVHAIAVGMPEPAGALAVFEIEDHVVVVVGTWSHRDRVQVQRRTTADKIWETVEVRMQSTP